MSFPFLDADSHIVRGLEISEMLVDMFEFDVHKISYFTIVIPAQAGI